MALEPRLQPWLADAFSAMSGGTRNANLELCVYYANLVTQGVMTAPKVAFLVQTLQNGAASSPSSFVGVIILNSRGSDMRERKVTTGFKSTTIS